MKERTQAMIELSRALRRTDLSDFDTLYPTLRRVFTGEQISAYRHQLQEYAEHRRYNFEPVYSAYIQIVGSIAFYDSSNGDSPSYGPHITQYIEPSLMTQAQEVGARLNGALREDQL